jgi:hypothetical protein
MVGGVGGRTPGTIKLRFSPGSANKRHTGRQHVPAHEVGLRRRKAAVCPRELNNARRCRVGAPTRSTCDTQEPRVTRVPQMDIFSVHRPADAGAPVAERRDVDALLACEMSNTGRNSTFASGAGTSFRYSFAQCALVRIGVMRASPGSSNTRARRRKAPPGGS